MVNEMCQSSSMSAEFLSSSPRCQDSKRVGFQNMQKMEQIRKNSVKSQQAPKVANNFGPMFRDRDHFNSLHFC